MSQGIESLTGEELFAAIERSAQSKRGGMLTNTVTWSLEDLREEFLRRLKEGRSAKEKLELRDKGSVEAPSAMTDEQKELVERVEANLSERTKQT